MPDEKNHLYGPADVLFDRKRAGKISAQQQFSQFSNSNAFTITDIANRAQQPALQDLTKPRIGNPYNDTHQSPIGLIGEVIFFDIFGSEYSFYTVNNDISFSPFNLPQGRFVEYTLDIIVDTGGSPSSVAITFPLVLNPPTLAGNNGDHYVLKFIAVNRADDTGDVPEGTFTIEYIGGSFSSGGGGGISYPIQWPIEAIPSAAASLVLNANQPNGNAKTYSLEETNTAFGFGTVPPSGTAQSMLVTFIQDTTGGRTISTSNVVVKNGGIIDSFLDKTSLASTTFRFTTTNQGVLWTYEVVDSTVATVSSLNDLTDVSVTGATNGQFLRFNSTLSLWTSVDTALNDLSDVTAVGASNTVLKRNPAGTLWVAGNVINVNVDAAAAIAGSKIDMLLNQLSNVGTTTTPNTVLKTVDGVNWGGGNIQDNNVDAAAAIAWTKISKTGSKLDDIGDVTIGPTISADTVLKEFGGVWVDGKVLNVNVGGGAAIAGSKINMLLNELSNVGTTGSANTVLKTLDGISWGGGNIQNNNVDAAAAIAGSKIDMLLNQLSNVGTTTTPNTVLKTVDGVNWGGGNIQNNNVDAAAAIAGSKIDMLLNQLSNVGTTTSSNTVLKTLDGISWGGGNIQDNNVDAAAAIAWTKINKTGSILTDIGDVSAVGSLNTVLIRNAAGNSWISKFVDNTNISNALITGQTELTSGDEANDFLLIYDASAGALRKIHPDNLGISGGGGEVFTWTANHNANGFNLINPVAIEFKNANNTFPAGSIPYIGFDTTNLGINVPSGEFIVFTNAGATKVNIGVAGLTMFGTSVINGGGNKAVSFADPTVSTDLATKNYVDTQGGTNIDGIQDVNIWFNSDTDPEFDFEVYHSNSKQGRDLADDNFTNYGANTIFYVPIYLGERARLNRLGYHLSIFGTAPTSNYTVQMGLYANRTDGKNYPGQRVDSANGLQNTAKGAHTVFMNSTDLEAGQYWIALLWNTPSTLPIGIYSPSEANSAGHFINTALSPSLFMPILGYTDTNETSLPTTPEDDMSALTLQTLALFVRFEFNPN